MATEKLTKTDLEQLANSLANARATLAGFVSGLQSDIDAAKKKHLPTIRRSVAAVKDQRAALLAAIEANPGLFDKPRSMTLYGLRFGYQKNKGEVIFDDEAKVVGRIRAQLPQDQVELLIRITEKIHKPAVYDLTAADLKRLGIRIENDGDGPFVRDTTSEIDKLVSALLKDDEEVAA